jgi:hypothetical protein
MNLLKYFLLLELEMNDLADSRCKLNESDGAIGNGIGQYGFGFFYVEKVISNKILSKRKLFRFTLVDYSHFNLLKHTVPGSAGYKQLVYNKTF